MDRIKIEIGWGAKFDKTGALLQDIATRLQGAEFEFMRVFGAFTRYTSEGGWKSPESGAMIFEKGYTLFVVVDDTPTMRCCAAHVAAYVKGCFNQEAVVLTITPCTMDLI